MYRLLLVGLLGVAAPAWAQRPGAGQCFNVDARKGTPFVVEGTVADYSPGAGYTIDTGEEEVEVHGIGPTWFWADEGVPRPQVGDAVRIEGYQLDCGAGEENLAVSVTVGDKTLQVRDAQTGLPRWGTGRRGRR